MVRMGLSHDSDRSSAKTGSAARGRRWLLLLAMMGLGCADESDFEDRIDELRRQIGSDAQVCPAVDEDFPCGPEGPAGYRCIAAALQACNPAEVHAFDADGEDFWFVVPSGESCELVALRLQPALVTERLRFTEQTCAEIEAVPSESVGCTTFSLRQCD